MNEVLVSNEQSATIDQQEAIFNYDQACAEIKARTLYPFGNSLNAKNILAISGSIILFLLVFSLFLGATTMIAHKIFNNSQGYAAMGLSIFFIIVYAFIDYHTEKYHKENNIPIINTN